MQDVYKKFSFFFVSSTQVAIFQTKKTFWIPCVIQYEHFVSSFCEQSQFYCSHKLINHVTEVDFSHMPELVSVPIFVKVTIVYHLVIQ